jgi:hypothetical protein
MVLMNSDNSDEELDHEDDQSSSVNAMVLCILAYEASLSTRSAAVNRQRLQWRRRVHQLESEGAFERTYRMTLASFNTLLSFLRADIACDASQSTCSTGVDPIEPEIVLHCVLRWLAGGSYIDIRDVAEISVASFYRVVHVGLRAIVKCDHLAFRFPSTLDAINRVALRFQTNSSFGVMNGCVGCLDGMLCKIKTPARSETRNARSYFSGHYQTIGVNVQALCDDLCRFTYVCVAAPGGTNDVHAFAKTKLKQLVDDLPVGKYILADNAYVPTEHLLTPFSGSQKSIPELDSFNFYLSQLRIKIEQAFGLMTTKWRILRRPLQVKLKNVGTIIMAISRLHNFVISERPEVVLAEQIDPFLCNGSSPRGYLPSDHTIINIAGESVLRDRIVRHIRANALVRPQYNMVRNR